MAIPNDLIGLLRREFRLDWHGIHGAPHWARVRLNGLRLARLNGANPRVVELFAFVHDARRWSDGHDPHHGERAAQLATAINSEVLHLLPEELNDLQLACRDHSHGYTRANVTVQTCWDADRLELGRIGIVPRPERLCTSVAKLNEIIDEAFQRSLADSSR